MARASSLPSPLRYLQPFRSKFAKRSPEELNEDSGPSALMALFSKRVRSLPLEQAEKLLEKDLTMLQDWLAAPAQVNDPLHFALGFSLIASPAEIARLIKEEAEKPLEPKLCLRMELPPGAKERHVEGSGEEGMLVSWQGLLFVFNADTEQRVAKLGDPSWRNASEEVSVSSIRFGQVTGRKFVIKGESWRGPCKDIKYVLAVPGGHVYGSVSAIGKKLNELNWDETKLEAYFHTLHVVTVLPPATDA